MQSLRAQIAELLGRDPDAPRRPTVAEVAGSLAPGEIAAARRGRAEVAVIRLLDGRLCVVDDRCPHDGGRISDGWLDGDRLVCARHGWELDPCVGACPRVK